MRKTVEIEYVGIEDIQDIMDDCYYLQKQGHYVSFEMKNLSQFNKIYVYIMLNGWNSEKDYDYGFEFNMSDSNYDVAIMNECKNTIKNLLVEED